MERVLIHKPVFKCLARFLHTRWILNIFCTCKTLSDIGKRLTSVDEWWIQRAHADGLNIKYFDYFPNAKWVYVHVHQKSLFNILQTLTEEVVKSCEGSRVFDYQIENRVKEAVDWRTYWGCYRFPQYMFNSVCKYLKMKNRLLYSHPKHTGFSHSLVLVWQLKQFHRWHDRHSKPPPACKAHADLVQEAQVICVDVSGQCINRQCVSTTSHSRPGSDEEFFLTLFLRLI